MMCADGYLPVVVEDEPLVESFQYFTCCPPHHSSINVTRHCSDPIMDPEFFTAEEDATDYCGEEETRITPRPMQIPYASSTYMCCDATEDSNATNFLEETECVSYRNPFYTEAKVENEFGKLSPMTCNLPAFPFAQPLYDGEGNYDPLSGRYQCCKTGPSSLSPFVEDNAFRTTVYIPITLYLVLVVASSLVVFSLAIPLIIQIKNGVFKQKQSLCGRGLLSGISRLIGRSGLSFQDGSWSAARTDTQVTVLSQGGPVISGASTRSLQNKQRFSSYNLYLIFLALADVLAGTVHLVLYFELVAQNYWETFFPVIVAPFGNLYSVLYSREWSVGVAYMAANVYLNAIVAYEVMVLLRSSKNMRKARPPSLTRVTYQALSVTLLASVLFAIDFFVRVAAWREYNLGNFERSTSLLLVLPTWNTTILALPLVATLGITFWIWWKGYMPKATGASAQKKAVRELSLYFFRIIALFNMLWLPLLITVNYCFFNDLPWGVALNSYAGPLQGIISACLIMTKSDVRKYVWDLITLSYCTQYCGCCSMDECEDAKETVKDSEETHNVA